MGGEGEGEGREARGGWVLSMGCKRAAKRRENRDRREFERIGEREDIPSRVA